jgi:hypothetical protein
MMPRAAYTVAPMTPPTEVVREDSNTTGAEAEKVEQGRVLPAVAWASLGFAVLQSVCTVLIGLGGARLVISVLSVAAASSFFANARWLHQDALRLPMVIFAVLGAVVNLVVVWQVRRLRNRPAAQWRLNAAAVAGKLRQERWQIGLAELTLVLVVVEEWIHLVRHHRL